MSTRTVFCSKLKRESEGLSKPPFSGALGQEVFERVSAEAWKDWQDNMMIKVINEYRLNMADEEHYKMLMTQLKAFLGLDGSGAQLVEVGNAERGRDG